MSPDERRINVPGAVATCRGACAAFVASSHARMKRDVVEQAVVGQQLAAINFLRQRYPGADYAPFFKCEFREFRKRLMDAKVAKEIIDSPSGLGTPRFWEDVLAAGTGSLAGGVVGKTTPAALMATALGAMLQPLGREVGREAFRELVKLYAGTSTYPVEGGITLWKDRPQNLNKQLSMVFQNAMKDPVFRKIYNEQIAAPSEIPIAGESEEFYIADNEELFALLDLRPEKSLDNQLADEKVQARLSDLIRRSVAPTPADVQRMRDEAQAKLTDQTLMAGANLLESAFNLSNRPVEARVFRTVFDGAMTLQKNFADLQAGLKTIDDLRKAGQSIEQAKAVANLTSALMTFNMISLGLAVVSAFSQQKSESSIILEQLGMIAQQIANLRKEMHERFDRVDAKLDNLLDVVSRGFDELKYSQTWTLQKLDDLANRVVDDAKRKAADLRTTGLFEMLTSNALNAGDFGNDPPETLTSAEALARSRYLYDVGQLSTEPVYHDYSGGTLADIFDFVVGEHFLARVDPSAPLEGPVTGFINDHLGLMFDAYEALQGANARFSALRVPNINLWRWSSEALITLYQGQTDRAPLADTVQKVAQQGGRFAEMASFIGKARESGQSVLHALLQEYGNTLAGSVLPALRESIRAAELEAIKELSAPIERSHAPSDKSSRVSSYCVAAQIGFDDGHAEVLARTKSFPIASPEMWASQYDFLALNSVLREKSEPLSYYACFVEEGEAPVAEINGHLPEAFPAGTVLRAKKVRRLAGIAGSFNAVRKTARLAHKTFEINGLEILRIADNVTKYEVPMNTAMRNTLEYFYLSESPDGDDWPKFANYLRKIGQFVPMSNAAMTFDPKGMARIDRLIGYLGGEFRQRVFQKIGERVRADLLNPTSKLAKAAAAAGYYKHALRVALELSVGPEMEKRSWLWLRFNGPDSLIDTERLFEIFQSPQTMTAALLGYQEVELNDGQPSKYSCGALEPEKSEFDADCLTLVEFRAWADQTNRLHRHSYRRAGQALYPHLAQDTKLSFFDPAEVFFADHLGFPTWKNEADDLGYPVPGPARGGWLGEIDEFLRNLPADVVGTVAPVRLQLALMEPAALA